MLALYMPRTTAITRSVHVKSLNERAIYLPVGERLYGKQINTIFSKHQHGSRYQRTIECAIMTRYFIFIKIWMGISHICKVYKVYYI